MSQKNLGEGPKAPKGFSTKLFALCLLAILIALFHGVLVPGSVLFSNDGPLGAASADFLRPPSCFLGVWQDLNTVGSFSGNYPFGITGVLFWALGPLLFSKFYAAFTVFYLGLCAWYLFRSLKLAPLACAVGAIAAALNSTFFSAACWGVGTHDVAIGSSYLALGLAVSEDSGLRRGIKLALAGMAVGLAVSEGADIGAIFSLYVAAFVVYHAWGSGDRPVKKLAVGIGRVAVVALFAGFLAAQTITTLVATQIKGVAGTQQDTRTRKERWDWATQWSLPKREALGLIVPGLFGYRMDTPDGGVYWGAVGRDPGWYHYWESGKQGQPPAGGLRFSGGGIYTGVLVAMVAFWAALQSFRKQDSVFTNTEKRLLWFWAGAVIISLLLAFGRFAPFYQVLYALPYLSAIRNPGKFLHPMSWAIVILFAYGVDGLWRRYMAVPVAAYSGLAGTVKAWWRQVRGFDRGWTAWSVAVLALSLLGWLIYASSANGLQEYLQEVGYSDKNLAAAIASFSFRQVGWFVLALALGIGVLTAVLSGVFSGRRAKWGAICLALFVAADLGRANQPWIIVWDYQHKYATNPVIDMLRQKPCEQRVAILPRWFGQVFNLPPQLANQEQIIDYLYGIEWSQHLFLYYNIQSLDVVQMPRMPEDLLAFDMTFTPRGGELTRVARKWQLTNTRYLIGAADFLGTLNQLFDPAQHRFRYKERFTVAPKPGYKWSNDAQDWTAIPDTNGPFAVFEFTAALPRVKLYSNWESNTNDQAALEQLASPSFDPEQRVIVHGSVPAPATASTNPASAKVEFASYAPKQIVLKAESAVPAVLLLNDRYDPNWNVLVDGKPQTLLKCNYLMQGVFLPAGPHTVEFRFEPPMKSLYVSLAGVGLAIILCGLLLVVRSAPRPAPAPGELAGAERKNSRAASATK